jgi:hypothetical protein
MGFVTLFGVPIVTEQKTPMSSEVSLDEDDFTITKIKIYLA